jgi:hypothetical protein
MEQRRKMLWRVLPIVWMLLGLTAQAETPAAVRTAIAKSLPLLQEGSRTFRERSEGQCISCHHQGLILPTVALARARGFPIAEEVERAEIGRVYGFYARRRGLYERALVDPNARREAERYGNYTVHAGLWFWGLAAEKVPPDEATDTAVRLLADDQLKDGHWDFEDAARAPMQAGPIPTTALAIFVLRHYAPKDYAKRAPRTRDWLVRQPQRTTDDKAFRLLGLHWTETDAAVQRHAVNDLIQDQRADGGWAQQANMPTDAYATGLALYALNQAGGVAVKDRAYGRGVEYLLKTQRADGSWFVKTHAIPSNPYFESGFPHGKSQFISYAASCWATMALTLTVERTGASP